METLRPKDDYRLVSVRDIFIEQQEASKVSFEKAVFTNVTVTESTLEGIELTDVLFDKCDLSNIYLNDSFLHRVEFRHCKLIGTDWTRSRLQHVRFEGCVGDYSAFRFASFKHAAFGDCSLLGAHFFHSVLQHTFFTSCRIDKANMTGTKLEGIDLSDCEFDGLLVDIEDLRGCIVSPQHVSSFAALLGLIVKP
ncbi:pentapeptide repeat-containing protein [Paenibacillus ginsengarvi]